MVNKYAKQKLGYVLRFMLWIFHDYNKRDVIKKWKIKSTNKHDCTINFTSN